MIFLKQTKSRHFFGARSDSKFVAKSFLKSPNFVILFALAVSYTLNRPILISLPGVAGAVVVAQLVERSLTIAEVRGSNQA